MKKRKIIHTSAIFSRCRKRQKKVKFIYGIGLPRGGTDLRVCSRLIGGHRPMPLYKHNGAAADAADPFSVIPP